MKQPNQKDLMQGFIDSLTFAAGASWQMIHAHQDPRFIPIRDMLEAMKKNCMVLALGPSDDMAEEHARIQRLRQRGLIIPN